MPTVAEAATTGAGMQTTHTSPTVTRSGAVCAAALAARRARQFRQKRLGQATIAANGAKLLRLQDDDGSNVMFRAASPVSSPSPVGSAMPPPYHVKKNLNLHLDLGGVKSPNLPLMLRGVRADVPPPWPAQQHPHQHEQYASSGCHESPARSAAPYASSMHTPESKRSSHSSPTVTDTRQRRKSSVTFSMSSPEAAEFRVVAHDGPAELGRRTKRIKKLGRGAGGVVHLGVYVPTLKLVAVKDVTVYKDADQRMVQHELHALHANVSPLDSQSRVNARDERCPFLMGFYGAYLRPSKGAVSIVTEFMELGSMQDLLNAQHTISEDVLRHAAFCCLSALDHMHSRRMVHRDIKPANILINRQGDFKVGDFGLAGTLAQSESFFSEFEGTIMYMAPERISGENYDCVSDVWSLGVALFYLATGVYPFSVDDGFFGLEEAICTDPLPPMPNRFSPTCRDFMKGLLRREPSKRTTAEEALQHPFLANYWGSTAHDRFESAWQEIALPSSISSADVETLAEVIADQAVRYPHVVNLGPLEKSVDRCAADRTNVDMPLKSPRAFFANMSRIFSTRTTSDGVRATNTKQHSMRGKADPLDDLADMCSVPSTYLRDRIHQAIRNARSD